MVARVFLFIVVLPLAVQSASGQEPIDLRNQPPAADTIRNRNNLSIVFSNVFNSYHWSGLGSFRSDSGALSLSVNEAFLSSVLRTSRVFITDQQQADLTLRQRLSSTLRLSTRASSFIVSDDRGINLGQISTNNFYGGVEYRPFFRFALEPLIGLSFDKQLGQTDKGVSYLFSASLDTVDFSGYQTVFNGMWNYDQLTPRRRETRTVVVSIDKPFFEQTRNSLEGLYSHTRRDVYTPADAAIQQSYGVQYNIESRTEDVIGLTDTLGYSLGAQTLLSLRGTVAGREIGRSSRYLNTASPSQSSLPTTIDEFRLESSALLSTIPIDGVQASVRFDYLERDERHTLENPGLGSVVYTPLAEAEERKNNHSRRTGLNGALSIRFSKDHSLNLQGSGNLLRYDTPSEQNDDDRDELWYAFTAGSSHRLSRSLFVEITADAHLMHLVYLNSTRSASNTWNRVLRLAPKFDFIPSSVLFTSNTFEVLANYTSYDYEFPSSPIRSFAYRQFSFHDSSTYRLTRRLSLVWMHHLKFYEQGQFRWDDFSELPVNYYEDKLYLASVRYYLNPGLLFSVGFRYFSQIRYNYRASERQVDRFLRSTGPSTEIAWKPNDRTSWSVQGWYERQRQTGETVRGYTTMTMSLSFQL